MRPLSNQLTSNGCRDARSVRPLCQSETCNGCRDARSSVRCVKARRVTVVGTHDLCVRCVKARRITQSSYKLGIVTFNGNGRTSVRPYNRYTSVRPYKGYSSRACLPQVIRPITLIPQIALIKRTSQEVRRIVAVGRRGYVPERPMDRRTW